MHRKKQIIYIAHCVLNQNSVIREWERAQGAFNDIIRVIIDNNISIIQLPCPEFTFLGEDRPPKTKEEYDTPEYREICTNLASKVVNQMKEYLNHEYKIIGILGIMGSPSCDTLGKRGIFIEELQQLMIDENIQLDTFDIPEEYLEGEDKETVESFKKFIDKK
ncbi:hypothetical protein GOQ27_09820 [Clostridium sp. D2Q-11]|uniref:DUF523 domain-containing protein n=1 Tax=Anaeromonas frigoriresistens TaxID=2683708 RepID=A0A942Z7J4_9FIRM|nr:CD3072 family TudS-related putative desulfidase [Anaeromonas frigoriresistens]MBS4538762.1 hypothetical protein [Anaeromonas frigoriresistens]